MTVDEYYRWVFENRVPGLAREGRGQGLTPLAYMRRYGVVEVAKGPLPAGRAPTDARPSSTGRWPRTEEGVLRKPTDDSVPPLVGEAGAVGVLHDDGTGHRAG